LGKGFRRKAIFERKRRWEGEDREESQEQAQQNVP